MDPYLKGNSIIVDDRRLASTLINKGDYGKPLKGGGLEISLLEAAYLMASGRIQVRSSENGDELAHHQLISLGLDLYPEFLEQYLVFRDIRNRGINIQGGNDKVFMAYPRGKRPGSGRADRWIKVFRGHDRVIPSELLKEAIYREKQRMEVLAAVVDGDWDQTYYSLKSCLSQNVRKDSRDFPALEKDISRMIPGGGAMVWGNDVMRFAENRGMGSNLSDSRLFSLEERNLFVRNITDNEKSITFRDLTERGFLVRTGFKYGSHFRVYTSGNINEHSDLLIHCIGPDEAFTWEELSRAIRLCHSVRKRMIFSIVNNDMPGYLEIKWKRP